VRLPLRRPHRSPAGAAARGAEVAGGVDGQRLPRREGIAAEVRQARFGADALSRRNEWLELA
jgi:hypothetical protein